MKQITLPLIACLALASSAFAGEEIKENKEPVPTESCFRDQELQIDVFSDWTDRGNHEYGFDSGKSHDGFGGGIGVNYFFMRYVGVGMDSSVTSTSNGLWNFSGSLITRFPIEMGGFCIAPYALGGGGFQTDGINAGSWHVGGGLEWRVTHHMGIYAEGRYTWVGGHVEDTTRVSLGVRYVF